MDSPELTLKCRQIVAAVQTWQRKQDELTLAPYQVATELISTYGFWKPHNRRLEAAR